MYPSIHNYRGQRTWYQKPRRKATGESARGRPVARDRTVNFYEHAGALYLNITNRCPVSCTFCVKKDWGHQFRGQDLNLGGQEPQVRDLIGELGVRLERAALYREVVFCGFGEPTMRMDAVNAVGLHARLHHPNARLRLNTIGLGDLIQGRDLVPELALFLDSVSVSLNTADPDQWEELHRPSPAYKGRGFDAAVSFATRAVRSGIRTRVTAIDLPGIDLPSVSRLARSIGAEFALRPTLA